MTTVFLLGSALQCILPFVGVVLVYLAAAMARRKFPVGLIASGIIAMLVVLVLSMSDYYLTGRDVESRGWIDVPAILAAIIAFVLARRVRQSVTPDWRRWYLLAAGLVIPLSLLGAAVSPLVLDPPCNEQDRIAGVPIISALESYQRDLGDLPKDLRQLVPQYLPAIPRGMCQSPLDVVYSIEYGKPGTWHDFHLCEANDRLKLAITTAGADRYYQAYDLTDRKWLVVDILQQGCFRPR